jgi:hypothetical protein
LRKPENQWLADAGKVTVASIVVAALDRWGEGLVAEFSLLGLCQNPLWKTLW